MHLSRAAIRRTILILVLGSLFVTGGFTSARSHMADLPPSTAPTTFMDRTGTLLLTIQLETGDAASGQFLFYAGGRGTYLGLAVVSLGSDGLDHLSGTYPVQFVPDSGAATEPVKMHISGYLDPVRLTGHVSLAAHNGPPYHYDFIAAPGSASAAANVAQEVVTALQAGDWATLYTLSVSDIQSQISQAANVQALASQASQGPTIVGVTLNGTGQATTDPSGYQYYVQPITVQAKGASGITQTFSANLYLILDHGVWRFYSTDALTAPS